MRFGRFIALAVALFVMLVDRNGNALAESAPGQIEIDRIFAPSPLGGSLPQTFVWAPDGSRFLYVRNDAAGKPVTHVYAFATRTDRIFFRAHADGKGSRPAPEFVWSPDSTHLAYLDDGDVWTIDAGGGHRRKLASDGDDPQWSPDGSKIAYVHANDLFATVLASHRVIRYSNDGTDEIVNGDPDWVYSEELSMAHAYRWSPDSQRIAYLRFDRRPIVNFPIVDYLAPAAHEIREQRYPLAGKRNSIVTLRVAEPGSRFVAYYSTRLHDDYLASVSWTPRGLPAAQILDRTQRHLRFVEFASPTRTHALASEKSPYWVDVYGSPRWLADGHRFLFASARDGVESLYLGDRSSGRVRRLTRGFRIGIGRNGDGNGDDGIIGIDESRGIALVSAAFPTREDETALEVPLSGGRAKPLDAREGNHEFYFARDARHFVRSDSTFVSPPVFSAGVFGSTKVTAFARFGSLAGYALGAVLRGTLPSKYGKLDYYLIRPPDFDPAKKYPVITYVYGGPASPTTTNGWGGSTYLFHQALAERGFVIFSVDGPGSQVDSTRNERELFHAFGPGSLEGQLAGADFLATLPYVDAKRIGIWGWSFGGYETTYALTHAPQTWKVGVAVAPVTDWARYDSIYTERYMGSPAEFPNDYARSSVVARAGALRGRLLIAHGTSDDNVHLANTIALTQAFILNDRQVDLMLFPQKTHSIAGVPQRRDLFEHMLRYWQEHL